MRTFRKCFIKLAVTTEYQILKMETGRTFEQDLRHDFSEDYYIWMFGYNEYENA